MLKSCYGPFGAVTVTAVTVIAQIFLRRPEVLTLNIVLRVYRRILAAKGLRK